MNRVRNYTVTAILSLSLMLALPVMTFGQGENENRGRVRGKITAINGTSIDIARRDGSAASLATTAETTFTIDGEPATLAELAVDDHITARVHPDGNGGLIADDVRSRSERPPQNGGRVSGLVSSVDATQGSITVTLRGGNTVVIFTTADTRILRNRQPATVADFVAGDRVKAHGERDPNGQFIADRVLGGTRPAE